MNRFLYHSASLGEIVVTTFDIAKQYSTDPREVSRLAIAAIDELLKHGRRRHMAKTSPSNRGSTWRNQ